MYSPLVTIIIPAFNAEKHLAETIVSAKNQTYKNLEIIIIDDGSTDQTLSIAQSFELNSIKILKQVNKGASAARNYGIKEAKGKYIQFLDADDLLSLDKIENQVTALEKTSDKLAVCSTIHFNENENPFLNTPSEYEEDFLYTTDKVIDFTIKLWGGYNFKGSMIQPNAWLVPKVLIDKNGSWDESLTLDDDGEFFGRMLLNCKGVIKTNGFNYYRKYFSNPINLSAKKGSVSMKSALKSILLKKKSLFFKSDIEEAKMAIFKQLKELERQCFPFHRGLLRSIRHELSQLPSYKIEISLGGPTINLLAKVLGWKTARLLQQIYSISKKTLTR